MTVCQRLQFVLQVLQIFLQLLVFVLQMLLTLRCGLGQRVVRFSMDRLAHEKPGGDSAPEQTSQQGQDGLNHRGQGLQAKGGGRQADDKPERGEAQLARRRIQRNAHTGAMFFQECAHRIHADTTPRHHRDFLCGRYA